MKGGRLDPIRNVPQNDMQENTNSAAADNSSGQPMTDIPVGTARTEPSYTINDDSIAENSDVGRALRAAYQTMVEEAIPDEMLDLLSKLT